VAHCFLILLAAILLCLPATAAAVDLARPAFAGSQSCMSSSCHGGGVGKDQGIIWAKKDPHSRADAVLSTARSARMAEALKIPDPKVSVRCTVCHSPMETLPAERFSLLKNFEPEKGVSCESCHGASEPWVRFHTRPDVSHAQRVAAGLRELTDLYARANACVACHLNLDPEIANVGRHPELSTKVPVRPDGKITAPLIEDLVAIGRTPAELGREIEERLKKYVREPNVTVSITSFVGNANEQVRVVGQATKPAALPYKQGMTLLDVMIQVGGITDYASGNRAVLIRKLEGNKQYGVRLRDLLKGGDVSANVEVLPGDVIMIPESWF
jgi:polysaccharide export outer membrane protein